MGVETLLATVGSGLMNGLSSGLSSGVSSMLGGGLLGSMGAGATRGLIGGLGTELFGGGPSAGIPAPPSAANMMWNLANPQQYGNASGTSTLSPANAFSTAPTPVNNASQPSSPDAGQSLNAGIQSLIKALTESQGKQEPQQITAPLAFDPTQATPQPTMGFRPSSITDYYFRR